jgi:hypothetical protein
MLLSSKYINPLGLISFFTGRTAQAKAFALLLVLSAFSVRHAV